MRKMSVFSFALLELLVVVVSVSWLITRIDWLWDDTSHYVAEQFAPDRGLEERLRKYWALGVKIRPVFDLMATANALKGPAKASGVWDSLKSLSPVTAIALEVLDDVSEDAAKLDAKLARIGEMDDVGDAISTFRAQKDRETVKRLAIQCKLGARALSGVEPELVSFAGGIQSLHDRYSDLLEVTCDPGDTNPFLNSLAIGLCQALQLGRQPIAGKDEEIQFLRVSVHHDIGALRAIYWRVAVASAAETMLAAMGVAQQTRVGATYVVKHLGWALYAGATLMVGGWGFRLAEARRAPRPMATSPSAGLTSASTHPPKLSGWLLLRTGPTSHRTFALPPQGPFTIGSEAGSGIQIRGASAHHASVTAARSCYFLEDLGSTTGTFLNGDKIATARRLRHGDVIVTGGAELVFLDGGVMGSGKP